MSLSTAPLAFDEGGVSFQGLDRPGILSGSFVAGLAGDALLRATLGEGAGSG